MSKIRTKTIKDRIVCRMTNNSNKNNKIKKTAVERERMINKISVKYRNGYAFILFICSYLAKQSMRNLINLLVYCTKILNYNLMF